MNLLNLYFRGRQEWVEKALVNEEFLKGFFNTRMQMNNEVIAHGFIYTIIWEKYKGKELTAGDLKKEIMHYGKLLDGLNIAKLYAMFKVFH